MAVWYTGPADWGYPGVDALVASHRRGGPRPLVSRARHPHPGQQRHDLAKAAVTKQLLDVHECAIALDANAGRQRFQVSHDRTGEKTERPEPAQRPPHPENRSCRQFGLLVDLHIHSQRRNRDAGPDVNGEDLVVVDDHLRADDGQVRPRQFAGDESIDDIGGERNLARDDGAGQFAQPVAEQSTQGLKRRGGHGMQRLCHATPTR